MSDDPKCAPTMNHLPVIKGGKAGGNTPGLPPLQSLHLLIFSRAPVAGRTKTRLIPALGAQGACDFHAACLNDLLASALAWKAGRKSKGLPQPSLHLFITPPASQAAFRSAGVAWPHEFSLHNQQGPTLGERMEDAFSRVRRGSPSTAHPTGILLVGCDLPLLGQRQWEAAVTALGEAEVVLGPTPDGGYYLIGTRVDPDGLFDVEEWGAKNVLEHTLANADKQGLSTRLIETLPDVDHAEDMAAVLDHPLATGETGETGKTGKADGEAGETENIAGRRSLELLRATIK